ncbi:MAG: serine hydrolase, partial [Actinobacteria bacterium]|nr:serine hydrolase [Actinomycetota bacterium]
VTVLVNGGPARPVFRAIGARVLRELAGVELPPAPVPDPSPAPFDASRVVGTYRSSMAETVVDRDDAGRVWLEQTPTPVAAGLGDQPYRTELVGWRGDTLLTAEPENDEHTPYAFLGGPARGPAAFLHDGRAHPRSS